MPDGAGNTRTTNPMTGRAAKRRNAIVKNRLEPCPFCMRKYDDHGIQTLFLGYEYPYYRISCVTCGIVMKQDREDKVISIWNNRKKVDTD